MKKDDVFDAILESEVVPELPRQAMGRTLPFVRANARVSVEDIYRLSQDGREARRADPPGRARGRRRARRRAPLAGRKALPRLRAAVRGAEGGQARRRRSEQGACAREASLRGGRVAPARESERAHLDSGAAPGGAGRGRAPGVAGPSSEGRGEWRARDAIRPARDLFRESGDLGFGAALCDYYEGAAASFERDYARGRTASQARSRGIRGVRPGSPHRARRGRARDACFVQKGDFERALCRTSTGRSTVLDAAAEPQRMTMALNNRATTLHAARTLRRGARDVREGPEPRTPTRTTPRTLFFIRTGLAELDFRRGEYRRALRAFAEIVREASPLASKSEILFSRLYVAECHGAHRQLRTDGRGNRGASPGASGDIRSLRRPLSASSSCRLDQGTIDADLIAHVREYLQDEENGVKRAYRPLRLVG